MHHGGSGASRAGSAAIDQIQPSVLSLPARWKANQLAGAGLSNLGNSCYLNSTLQCLAYVPPLAHLCLGRFHSSPCSRAASAPGHGRPGSLGSTALSTPCTFCIIERQLAALLRGSRGAAVSPSEVVRNLHLFGRSFVRGRQEDSHELLTAVLDVMERDGRRAAVALGAPKGCRTIVEELFLGRWQSQVRCLVCGHESNTYESFATLPLDIAQARSVMEGLRAFTAAERLDGNNKYKCDMCRQLVPALKQTTIWDDPNVLVLHLKRFDAGSLLGNKITRHVAFAETVDLQPFMTPLASRRRALAQQHKQQQQQAAAINGHHHHYRHNDHRHRDDQRDQDVYHQNDHIHGRRSLDGSLQQQQHQDGEGDGMEEGDSEGGGCGRSQYTLTGVLVHQGSSLHSGHYYAFVRDSNGGWSCMNDSHVYSTSREQVWQEQAYMLFYTRQSMKQPRPTPVPQPTTTAAATASAAAEGPALPPRAAAASAPGAAAGPARQVYGPQLPPHMNRGSGANGSTVPPGGAAREGPLPLRPSHLKPSVVVCTRLPAKVIISPKAAPTIAARVVSGHVPTAAAAPAALVNGHASSGDLARGSSAAAVSSFDLSAALPPPPAQAAGPLLTAATAAGPPEARKRKREFDGGGGGGEGAGGGGILTAVEQEVVGLKACASWTDGIKRLRLSVEEQLRGSGLPGAIREVVVSMQRSGLSLQQVLALGRGDPRRKALNGRVPSGVMQYGTDELRKLLRPLLMLLGWLGGPMPVILL